MPYNISYRASSQASTAAQPLSARAIVPTFEDGSTRRSTFWLSMLAPMLLVAALLVHGLAREWTLSAWGVGGVILFALVHGFPAQASLRFITTNLRRPRHFIPTVVASLGVVALAGVAATGSSLLARIGVDGTTSGHLAAFFTGVVLTTGGRWSMNYVEMAERFVVLLVCWGGSTMVQDFTLLGVGAVALCTNVAWRIQSRWIPQLPARVDRSPM